MAETTFTVDKENLEVRMERVFDASVDKVYEAMTDTEILLKWWGGVTGRATADEHDFRVGGKWRFVQTDDAGNEHAFRGEYLEIVPGKKIVNTFEYEPMAGHILTETAELEDIGGKTRMKSVSKYANIGDLEGMVGSGMEKGAVSSWEYLAEILEVRN